MTQRRTQIVVIGGGVSGMAAATEASRLGADTVIVDEFPQSTLPTQSQLEFRQSQVWGIFPEWEVAMLESNKPVTLRTKAVILATGATETTVPFPGCTLPGVMTRSGWDNLMSWGVIPGKRVVIVDAGGETQDLRDSLSDNDCDLVIETTPGDVVAKGSGRVEHVLVGGSKLKADILVVSGVWVPDTLLAATAGCQLERSPVTGKWQVGTDSVGQTNIAGVWACGSNRGGGLTRLQAVLEGRLCAASTCEQLGICKSVVVQDLLFEFADEFEEISLIRRSTATYTQPWITPLLNTSAP
jgi:pyruvate/2-oxoglutarate dehydrogenase complex dihydrolipoamide dehydrogenase (E3) component